MSANRLQWSLLRIAGLVILACTLTLLGAARARAEIDLPLVTQANGSADCNPASVAMILQWYQTNGQIDAAVSTDLPSVIEAFQTESGTRSGPYGTDLNEGALLDMVGTAVKLEHKRLATRSEAEAFLAQQIGEGRPVQVFMSPSALRYLPYDTSGWPGGHSIVAFAINDDSVTYADPWPGGGVRTVSRGDFDKLSHYVGPGIDTYAVNVYTPDRPPLPAPTNFAVSLDSRTGFGYKLNARWTYSSDREDGFQLYYQPEGGSPTKWFTSGANTQSATKEGISFDPDVPSKSRVCYWIVATAGGVESPRSNEFCLAKWEDEDIGADPPDGVWLEAPANQSTISADFLRLSARAYPAAQGGPGIERVEFTIWWPAFGPSTGPWNLGCNVREPILEDVYRCDIDLTAVPAGDFRISFDPYDTAGRRELAPDGTRQLIRQRNDTEPPGSGGSDPDPDGDGIPNSRDACDNVAENLNNHEDTDGCPDQPPVTDPDPDGDGIPNSRDGCDNVAENFNNYQDTDGCPDTPPVTDPDPDGDGFPNSRDRECPNSPETFNGYQDDDGCPDQPPASYTFSFSLLDWSDGETFAIGSNIGFCYELSPANVSYELQIWKSSNGGQYEFVDSWGDTGGGDCVWVGTVGGPTGTRTYLGRALVNGSLVAEDTTYIQVAGSDGGEDPGGGCNQYPGAPANVFVFGSVGGAPSTNRTINWSPGYSGGSGCSILEYRVGFAQTDVFLYQGTATNFVFTSSCSTLAVQQRNQLGWGPTAEVFVDGPC